MKKRVAYTFDDHVKITMTLSKSNLCKKFNMKNILPSSSHNLKKTKNADSPVEILGLNKSRIYNLEQRRKTDELLRKDLVSLMKVPDSENLNRDDFLLITNSWREEWEKGVQVPVNAEGVPRPNVRPFDLDSLKRSPLLKSSPSSSSAPSSSSGPSESNFKLPKDYIQALDSKTSQSSRYQLDAADIAWLKAVSDSQVIIDDDFLEDVINELEQQCAQNIQEKQYGIEFSDHVVCDVCQNPESEEGNEMVFCDRCNICVHQACYGITEIPEDEWLCSPCRSNLKKSPVCALCPNLNGAFKMTTDNRWVHVICVNWIPEAKFVEPDLLEPAEISKIPSWKRELGCSLCNVKGKGVSIKCDEKNCRVSYHVTCGIKHKIKMMVQVFTSKYTGKEKHFRLRSYCPKHSVNKKPVSDDRVEEYDYCEYLPSLENHGGGGGKTNAEESLPNLQQKFWQFIDIGNIYQKISTKYSIDKAKSGVSAIVRDHVVTSKSLHQLIHLIYNYWKLKRISNYGNSLIKPTFAQKFQEQNQLELTRFKNLRYQMENLRNLIYMSLRRERIKKNIVENQKKILEDAFRLFLDNREEENENGQSLEDIGRMQEDKLLSEPEEKLLLRIVNLDNHFNRPTMVSEGIKLEETKLVEIVDDETRGKTTPKKGQSSCQPSTSNIDAPSIVASSQENNLESKICNKLVNQVLRELKRFKSISTPRSSSNPYAKFYLSSSGVNKRKVNGELEETTAPLKKFRKLIHEFDQHSEPEKPNKTLLATNTTKLITNKVPQQLSTVMVTLRRRDNNNAAAANGAGVASSLSSVQSSSSRKHSSSGYNFRVTSLSAYNTPPACNKIVLLQSPSSNRITNLETKVNGSLDAGDRLTNGHHLEQVDSNNNNLPLNRRRASRAQSSLVNGTGMKRERKTKTEPVKDEGQHGFSLSMSKQHFRSRSFGTSPRSLPPAPNGLRGQVNNFKGCN